ncbi:DNA polymerase IV [Veillonella caviae]|uniref:DNA polymerase IV n=1 Tax=Veillonella caviae TaxID=248316 RepID=UPI0023F8565B|nr:DNA polymerase IV [Veillonella caviae]
MRRWIMHVDMDAFFASVEQLDHPEYKGHPVIVGGLSARGVVATASYEARKFGVHSAMPISRARKLCPHGIYVYPRFDRYKEISNIIHKVMEEFTPIIEPLSLDEAFLDVTGITHKFEGPVALGRAIKNRVFAETGLIISAGLAPNKFLAKLASDLEKPDGLVVIPYGKEQDMLAELPIKRIWGVGPRTEQRLKDGGFALMKDIQVLPDESKLIPYVGNQARRIWELARGIDDRPVEVNRQIQSIGNEETYEEDVVDPAVIDVELHYFANRVAKRLRKRNLMGHTVAIKVRYNDFKTVTRQKHLDSATDNERLIYDTSVLLWNKLMNEHKGKTDRNANRIQMRTSANRNESSTSETMGAAPIPTFDTSILAMPLKPLRLLGVTVSGLTADGLVQDDLFTAPIDESSSKLATVLDSLESKFGESAIMNGALWQRSHGLIGDRRKRSELKAAVDASADDNSHQDKSLLDDSGAIQSDALNENEEKNTTENL